MKRHQVLNLGRWRLSFWRGPTRFGVHASRGPWPVYEAGSAGLGLFGVNWLRRNRRRVSGGTETTP